MKTSFSCKFIYLFLPVFAAFVLFGCAPAISKPSPTPFPESTFTAESIQPTLTPTLTATAAKPDMQLLATLGKGSVSHIFRSPDGKTIFVGKAGELIWYDAKTFNKLGSVQLKVDTLMNIIFSSTPDIVAVNRIETGSFLAPVIDLKNQRVLTTTYGNEDDYLAGFLLSPDGIGMVYRRAGYTPDRKAAHWIELWNIQRDKLERQFMTNAQAKIDSPYVAGNIMSDPALSPDGKWVAAGCSDKLIYIWDTHTGKIVFTLKAAVASVVFSSDGSLLVSGGEDRVIRIWDIHTRTLIRTISAPDKVRRVSFSTDGTTLDIALENGFDQVLDLTTSKFSSPPELDATPDPFAVQLHRQGYSESFINADNEVAVSPDGNTLALASNTILLWDIKRRQLITSLENPLVANSKMVYSPNSVYLAVQTYSDGILVWNVKTGQSLSSSTDATSIIGSTGDSLYNGLAFSPDSTLLAAGRPGAVEFWNLAKAQQISTLELTNPTDIAMEIQFSKNSDDIYTLVGSKKDPNMGLISDKALETWDLKTGKLLSQIDLPDQHGFGDHALHWPFFARVNASLAQESWVELWDLRTGQFVKLETSSDAIGPIIFNSDASLLVAMNDIEQKIYFWKTNTGELVYISSEWFSSSHLSISPDSNILVVGREGMAQIWDIHQISEVALMPVITPAIAPTSLFWHPTPTPTKSP